MLAIRDFTVEYRDKALGIDEKNPRFSWKLSSDYKETRQLSYQITVRKDSKIVYQTNIEQSEQTVAVRYQGEDLLPRSLYQVSLTVGDNHGETACAETSFETGYLNWENIGADFITGDQENGNEAPIVFKKQFDSTKEIKKARLYASALGIYEFTLNGESVSDVHFAPGWTSYQKILQYQTYDITSHIQKQNQIEFIVANGWYKGILGFFNQGNHYGEKLALIAEIILTYSDGTEEIIKTDESWNYTAGPVRYSEFYHGETIDYTYEEPAKKKVTIIEQDKSILCGQQSEPVRITERIQGQQVLLTPEGDVVIDFGQNLTGVVEFEVQRDRGTEIIIRHAEALDENGNFYTKNLRTAKCTDRFICSGEKDIFRPKFTYHGFRYIAVSGMGEDLQPEDFTACVMHTDIQKTAYFHCDNEDVNRLMLNVDWGLRDNFLDIPSDCPQRDERLGYTGDTQIFLPTASIIRDVRLFYEKYLNDLRYEQSLGSGVPTTIPNILGPGGGISIWHDAAVIIPWILYERYGDRSILEQSLQSMIDCVDYYTQNMSDENHLIAKGQQLGDWVSMDVPRGPMKNYRGEVWNLNLNEKIGATDPYYIASVYYAYSAELLAKSARVLGEQQTAKKYEALHQQIVEAIRDEYLTKNGRVLSDTQTANAMALRFGIARTEQEKTVCMDRLMANLKQHDNHLTTGFAGTSFLCPVLSEHNRHDIAGAVFMKKDCPSWLYSVKLGATTMWELWDGVNEDGSFNSFEMNSLNHYSYGSIGGWVYEHILGIKNLEPGYKKMKIMPRLIQGITEISGGMETVYGKVEVCVSCHDGQYQIKITIPENTDALVCLPGRDEMELGSGTYEFTYETKDKFEIERYNMETPFSELLANETANYMLMTYAKELMENEMFLMFARDRSLSEVLTMLPAETAPLFQEVLRVCNQTSK